MKHEMILITSDPKLITVAKRKVTDEKVMGIFESLEIAFEFLASSIKLPKIAIVDIHMLGFETDFYLETLVNNYPKLHLICIGAMPTSVNLRHFYRLGVKDWMSNLNSDEDWEFLFKIKNENHSTDIVATELSSSSEPNAYEQFKKFVTYSPVATAVLDQNDKVLIWNESLFKLNGLSESDQKTKSFY